MPKKLILTLAVVLLLAVGIGVKFVGFNQEPKQAVEIAQAAPTPESITDIIIDASKDGPIYCG